MSLMCSLCMPLARNSMLAPASLRGARSPKPKSAAAGFCSIIPQGIVVPLATEPSRTPLLRRRHGVVGFPAQQRMRPPLAQRPARDAFDASLRGALFALPDAVVRKGTALCALGMQASAHGGASEARPEWDAQRREGSRGIESRSPSGPWRCARAQMQAQSCNNKQHRIGRFTACRVHQLDRGGAGERRCGSWSTRTRAAPCHAAKVSGTTLAATLADTRSGTKPGGAGHLSQTRPTFGRSWPNSADAGPTLAI